MRRTARFSNRKSCYSAITNTVIVRKNSSPQKETEEQTHTAVKTSDYVFNILRRSIEVMSLYRRYSHIVIKLTRTVSPRKLACLKHWTHVSSTSNSLSEETPNREDCVSMDHGTGLLDNAFLREQLTNLQKNEMNNI